MIASCYPFWSLMRFDRPAGTILLLWPTWWALLLANHGLPSPLMAFIFTFGVIVMRAAGCVVNDMADQEFDKHVTRTQHRPLAAGTISTKQAMLLLLILLSMASCLLIPLNHYTQGLAVVGFILAVIYPFTKRFFAFPQLVLGIVWSISILMVFTACNNQLSVAAALVYFAHIFLTIAYDTMYALADKPHDLKLGLHSSAILFGDFAAFNIALAQGAALVCLTGLGWVAELATPYFVGLIVVMALMVYQQWLIREADPKRCLQAFLNNQWQGGVLLLAIYCGLSVSQ